MEEFKIVLELLKNNSLSSLAIAWIVWKEILHPQWKKRVSGSYVSWKDLKNIQDRQGDHLKYLEVKVSEHLVKEQEEDVRMGKLEVKIEAIDKRVETENNHIFSQLKSLHDKFDKLTHIMLEKQP